MACLQQCPRGRGDGASRVHVGEDELGARDASWQGDDEQARFSLVQLNSHALLAHPCTRRSWPDGTTSAGGATRSAAIPRACRGRHRPNLRPVERADDGRLQWVRAWDVDLDKELYARQHTTAATQHEYTRRARGRSM